MTQAFAHSMVVAILGASTVASVSAPADAAESPREHQLWLDSPSNLLVDANVDKLDALWRRAAKVGYSHALLGDTKFCILENMPERYFHNVERVKKLAAELKIEI